MSGQADNVSVLELVWNILSLPDSDLPSAWDPFAL
jgi:hypothetical protein